jgi:hypothetical protein
MAVHSGIRQQNPMLFMKYKSAKNLDTKVKEAL